MEIFFYLKVNCTTQLQSCKKLSMENVFKNQTRSEIIQSPSNQFSFVQQTRQALRCTNILPVFQLPSFNHIAKGVFSFFSGKGCKHCLLSRAIKALLDWIFLFFLIFLWFYFLFSYVFVHFFPLYFSFHLLCLYIFKKKRTKKSIKKNVL